MKLFLNAYNKDMKKGMLIFFFVICIFVLLAFVMFNFVMYSRKYSEHVNCFANMYELDEALVYAVIKTESGFDENAVSGAGAKGLMQLMPKTAEWVAGELGDEFVEDYLFDAKTNIKYGCFYLRYLIDKFDNVWVAVAAYNAGELVVRSWIDENGGLDESKISYRETKNYVLKVKRAFKVYKNLEIAV